MNLRHYAARLLLLWQLLAPSGIVWAQITPPAAVSPAPTFGGTTTVKAGGSIGILGRAGITLDAAIDTTDAKTTRFNRWDSSHNTTDIVAFKGGTFVGQPASNTPCIDGWLNGVPVSLKELTGNGMTAVQRNIVDGTKQMKTAGQVGDMYIDATKTGISVQDVTNWVKPGTPISNILSKGTVNNINIKTTNGWVTLTRSTLKTTGAP